MVCIKVLFSKRQKLCQYYFFMARQKKKRQRGGGKLLGHPRMLCSHLFLDSFIIKHQGASGAEGEKDTSDVVSALKELKDDCAPKDEHRFQRAPKGHRVEKKFYLHRSSRIVQPGEEATTGRRGKRSVMVHNGLQVSLSGRK